MSEILTGATFLILMVMLLRRLAGARISMRFRYGLWLIVMLRLVVPVSFGSSPFSILNLAWRWPEDRVRDAEMIASGEAVGDSTTGEYTAESMGETTSNLQQGVMRQNAESGASEKGTGLADVLRLRSIFAAEPVYEIPIRFLLRFIWTAGMLAVGGYMLAGRLRFGSHLRRMRVEVPAEELPEFWHRQPGARHMQVYQAAGLPSPCLVGRRIYVAPQLLQERDRLSHVLSHEYAHAQQKDGLWSAVRSVLCAVYWFWPPVWIAAYEAKRDSELACDEHAIMLLGEEQRFAYGRTLLDLLSAGAKNSGYPGTALNMGGREKHVKERIFMIAGKNKKSRQAAAFVILAAMITCSCAFTGADATETGRTFQLTNKGSLTFETAAPENREAAEGQTQEQSERALDVQDEPGKDGLAQGAENTRQEEDPDETEALGAEHAAFQLVLDRMEDDGLESAEPVDFEAYYKYFYQGADYPMQDGQWYRLSRREESEIGFYGLYTKDYGFRGLRIKIGEEVNTFDQPWIPTSFEVNTLILERAETDGMPRSFAFTMCIANTGTTERWQCYVADRYDTGTIELYPLREEECREQLEGQKITLRVDQDREKAELVCEGNVVTGAVDISRYRDEKVEEAVWDEGLTGFRLEDGQITFITGIGLKVEDRDEVLYHGLSLIDFPVEYGSFGEHSFTLGKPYVDEGLVGVRLNQ